MRLKNVSVTLSHVGVEKIDFRAIMSPVFVLQFLAVYMPSTLAFPREVTSDTVVLPVNEALITSKMGAFLSQYDTTVGAPTSAKIWL